MFVNSIARNAVRIEYALSVYFAEAKTIPKKTQTLYVSLRLVCEEYRHNARQMFMKLAQQLTDWLND